MTHDNLSLPTILQPNNPTQLLDCLLLPMAPTVTTLSHLPYEIREKIFTYLVTAPWPLRFNDFFKVPCGDDDHKFDKILAIIDIFPSGPRFFYEENKFYLSDTSIPSFLAHTIPSSTPDKTTTPQNHITQLSTVILPHYYDKDEANKSLRLLLSCPRLHKVDIEISVSHRGLCEFDVMFDDLREVLWELGKKLGGDEGLSVAHRCLYERTRWTMEDFGRKRPPVQCGICRNGGMGY